MSHDKRKERSTWRRCQLNPISRVFHILICMTITHTALYVVLVFRNDNIKITVGRFFLDFIVARRPI